MLEERIAQDLKTALLAGDKLKVSVLRSLKSAITYAEVAHGVKGGAGLSDAELIAILVKESKKRQESAGLFAKGGAEERADKELQEKVIIDHYLPAALSREEIEKLVDAAVQDLGGVTPQTMGQVIGHVKQAAKGAADGAVVAQAVRERLKR
ncbi:MAG TPA: GatB/YqeY domain-containing protein [Candidatus Saccharimonadales bacterium]|jgi:hypothetical protein